MSVAEAARYLGHDREYLYVLMRSGKLGYIQISPQHRFIPLRELRRYLAEEKGVSA